MKNRKLEHAGWNKFPNAKPEKEIVLKWKLKKNKSLPLFPHYMVALPLLYLLF